MNVNFFLGVVVGGGGGGGSDGLSIVLVLKCGLAPICKLSFTVGFTPLPIYPSVLSTTVRSKLLACVWGVGVLQAPAQCSSVRDEFVTTRYLILWAAVSMGPVSHQW